MAEGETQLQRPRECTERELAKAGVELVDPLRRWLRCANCGYEWSPNILTGGRMPARYWQCPNECNADAKR